MAASVDLLDSNVLSELPQRNGKMSSLKSPAPLSPEDASDIAHALRNDEDLPRPRDIFAIQADDYHNALIDTSPVGVRPRVSRYSSGKVASSTDPPLRPQNGSSNGFVHLGSTYQGPDFLDLPSAFLPGAPRSLRGISARSYILGIASGVSLAFVLLSLPTNWSLNMPARLSFFLFALSAFHFLEFFATASYNPSQADTTAFLLTANGAAYNIAHSSAILEYVFLRAYSILPVSWTTTVRTNLFFLSPSSANTTTFSTTGLAHKAQLLGLGLMLLGQSIRFLAMRQAGASFNHIVQTSKARSHLLVTRGIYGWLRHPAYFGFFWWAVGTQLWLGNRICLVGYVVVLWYFFALRIEKEEEMLVAFFGRDYEGYRGRVRVGIPFIR